MGKFEKETYRNKYQEATEEELRAITYPETGEIRGKLMETVSCPLCDKNSYTVLFKKDGFTFVKCLECGLVYVNPQLREEKLINAYSDIKSNNIWIDVLRSKPQMEEDTKKFSAELDFLESVSEKGRLLDVGCSIGLFMKLGRERGWKTVGLELNKKAIKIAKEEYDLDVRESKLEDADLEPESFDVITLYGVLEHLKNPKEILKQCRGLCRQGGIVAILVPNLGSLAVRLMGEKTFTFNGRNHLQYFNIDTLKKMLMLCGFEPMHYTTSVSSLNAILNFIHGRDPYKTDDDIEIRNDIRNRIESVIFDMDLGYYIHMCGRRI